MIPFLITLRMFGRAIRYAWRDPAFQILAFVTVIALLCGMIFMHLVEGWGWLDSLYFCVITLATVGYGDFVPTTDPGKIFTMVYVFLGIGLLVSMFTRIAESLVKAREEKIERRSRERE